MEQPPKSFNDTQSSYLTRVLHHIELNLQSVKNIVNLSNNGILITGLSNIAIPNNCDYFILQGVVNVNTFSYKAPGSIITIRLKSGIVLKHSLLNLILKFGVDKTAINDEVIQLVSFGIGVSPNGLWKEL